MISVELLLGGVILLSLLVYCLTGGADFGGGVWDLFARGERAEAQRAAIRHAIGPIWEANHVWLIAVIVLMFVAFPSAYAALGTLLHVPLTLMLVGIVLRGSAFIFRSYGDQSTETQRIWDRVFSVSSTMTPVMLGVSLGAVASGQLPVDVLSGGPSSRLSFSQVYLEPWLQPFSLALGAFVLAMFAFLAAVYLLVEVKDEALQQDFRVRALFSGIVVGGLAWLCLALGQTGAPRLVKNLLGSWWSLPFQIGVGFVAMAAFAALWTRRYRLARLLVICQISGIVLGWGASQYPYIIAPKMTLANTAAPASVLVPVAWAFGIGGLLIVPAFGYLYKTFKG